MPTTFTKLTHTWNANPNAPEAEISVDGSDVLLAFFANPWMFPDYDEEERLELRFTDVSRYRLGESNDEGWYTMGKCRFSRIAPEWGEFYEVSGDLLLESLPLQWSFLRAPTEEDVHYLFYLKENTFECSARGWSMRRLPRSSNVRA